MNEDRCDKTWPAIDMAAQHERVGDLFLEVLDHPADQRLGFLNAACAGNTDLLDEVLSLLNARTSVRGFLETPLLEALRPAEDAVMECPKCGVCLLSTSGQQRYRCPEDNSELHRAFSGSPIIDDKYEIERRLGRGGMGAVYQARHVGLNRRFAVKLISPSSDGPAQRLLFDREAKALGQLKHPNIVDVTDYGVDRRGLPYLVMELIEGYSLENRIHSMEEIFPLLEAIASAVDFVHASGLLHRDLKWSNVIIGRVSKLVDFGLSSNNGAAAEWAGTPHYMAPELTRGEPASPSTDLYAFGVMAYVALVGKVPFDGEDITAIFKEHQDSTPPLPSKANSGLDPEMDRPLLALLEKLPARRPVSATASMANLRAAWLAARQRHWREKELPKRRWLSVALAFVALAVTMAAAISRPFQEFEHRSVDWRFRIAPHVTPDSRIMLVSVDEATLAADATPLASRASEFVHRFQELLDAGASVVAIDFLLPEAWSRSSEFSQLLMRERGRLILGIYSTADGRILGAESVSKLTASVLGPDFDRLFALVNVEEDPDGKVRRARLFYADQAGGKRFTLAAAGAARLNTSPIGKPNTFWIHSGIDDRKFERISWKDLPVEIKRPNRFQGRFVLAGGEYAGSGDDFAGIGGNREGITGLTLQAMIANTILTGIPVRDGPRWFSAAAILLYFAVPIFTMLSSQDRRVIWMVAAGSTVAFLLFCWLVFMGGWVVPIVTPLAGSVCLLLLSWGIRRVLPAFPAL